MLNGRDTCPQKWVLKECAVAPHATGEWSVSVPIPFVSPDISHSNISVHHYMKVHVDVPWAFDPQVKLGAPLLYEFLPGETPPPPAPPPVPAAGTVVPGPLIPKEVASVNSFAALPPHSEWHWTGEENAAPQQVVGPVGVATGVVRTMEGAVAEHIPMTEEDAALLVQAFYRGQKARRSLRNSMM